MGEKLLHYAVAILLITLGFYCLLLKRNLIKLIIGLSVMTDGIHILLVSIGYRAGGIAPILYGEIPNFATRSVDALPQALILTSIVINVCVTALALSLTIYAYRHYGTVRVSELKRLKE